MSYFNNDFSEYIWKLNYKYGDDQNISDTFSRVAKDVAKVENYLDDSRYSTKEFYDLMEEGYFLPGGRILANAGTGLDKATCINCFVSGFQLPDMDSMDEIQNELKRQAKILCSEGGYGFCISPIRPRGSRIGGVGVTTPGAVQMLDMWDTQAATIVAGGGQKKDRSDVKGKIRKGAQMVTMHDWHPDLLEFIKAKRDPTKLRKFNMSILISDFLMESVIKDDEWTFIFPDYEADHEMYKRHWNGNIHDWVSIGGEIKEYDSMPARELYDIIMKSTYNYNDPGILFVDGMNQWNNLNHIEQIDATNPCGEQILPRNGSCLLGNMILTAFVKLKEGKRVFDYDKFREKVHTAVRFLDNVNDMSFVPLTKQYEELQDKRRIGLGHMGFGSLCYMLGIRYGSSKAASLASAIQYALMDEAYYASAELAKEKGAFPLYNEDTFNRNYLNKLSDRTIKKVDEYGLRNSHLTSIQPTGNTSCLANNVSGGLEPIFMQSYQRSFEIPESEYDGDIKIPDVVAWESLDRIYNQEDINTYQSWNIIKQGNTYLLEHTSYSDTYRISRSRGLTKVVDIKDFAVAQMTNRELKSDYAVTTTDLTVEEHVKMMKAFAEYVDSAMSKTVNIPSDYPYEKFKEVYMGAWKSGVIKGITTYRAGTSEAVLTETKKDADKHSTDNNSSLSNTNDNNTDTNKNIVVLSDDQSKGNDRESSSKDGSTELLQLKLRIEALEKEVFDDNDRAAPKRPKRLPAKVTRVKHKGDIWHIAVGYLPENNSPYEIFAFKVEGDYSSEEAELIKVNSGNYDLLFNSEDEVIRDITSHTPSDEARLITRLISLALRHGVEKKFIINQISKANPSIASFGRAIEKALTNGYSWNGSLADRIETTGFADCCATPNIVYREGCVQCMNCGWSKC